MAVPEKEAQENVRRLLSSVINEKNAHTITDKGESVAVILPYEEFERLKKCEEKVRLDD